MNPNPINRDQARHGSAGARCTLARLSGGQRCCHATIDHREFQSARYTSSLVRRYLAGAVTRSGPFIRLGWCFNTDREFSEADCLVKAGVDSRVAAQLIANHTAAPGSIQGISERLPFHSNASFRSSSHASKTSEKRRQGRGILFQGLGASARGRGSFVHGGGADD